MRLGGLIFKPWRTPEEWAAAAKASGWSAVYFPVDHTAPLSSIDGFVQAAAEADLVIAEVGVWNNVLHPDSAVRAEAETRCVRQLELADYVGARCCVNIAGTYNAEVWDGPHRDNLTKRAFDDIVESCRRIIDAAKPKRTVYTLEPMPWMYPDTPESCLDLIAAIDRRGFGVHLDIVNVINSPLKYYRSGEVTRDWFAQLGPYVRSCHAKDTRLGNELTVCLQECRPGTGELDYDTYLTCAAQLDPDLPFMLEHMTEEEDYALAAAFLEERAAALGVSLHG